ncbi:phage replisome organizer N-terminal domain-containing protein [uncultured Megasphaera sp.]|uniref:phage replisome organizer N-terminal domain-containing protein n=1 Tax=uncultured Megasphaera sp. TaxID=165188 RepID=UPI0025912CEB|nr:phage replisome organizer N-terminal domain-containing protein [uncultured Megasphaera sp.]
MSKKIHWFKFHIELLNDPRILCLAAERNGEAYFYFFLHLIKLACVLRDQGYVYAVKGKAMTARQLAIGYHRNARFIGKALDLLEAYELIQRDDQGVIKINRWNELQGIDAEKDTTKPAKKKKSTAQKAAPEQTGPVCPKPGAHDVTVIPITALEHAYDASHSPSEPELDREPAPADHSQNETTPDADTDSTCPDYAWHEAAQADDTASGYPEYTWDEGNPDDYTAGIYPDYTWDEGEPDLYSQATHPDYGQNEAEPEADTKTASPDPEKSEAVQAYIKAFGSITPETARELMELEQEEDSFYVVGATWIASYGGHDSVDYIAGLIEKNKKRNQPGQDALRPIGDSLGQIAG